MKNIQGLPNTSADNEKVNEYVDNVLSSLGFGLFQMLALLLAGCTNIAYVSESLTVAFVSVKVTKLWNINSLLYASIPASTCISNVLGQVVFGYIADKYGRKWPYVASLVMIGTFTAASSFSNGLVVFGVLRNVVAIGVGGTFVLKIPTLMEFLPVNYRGMVAVSTGLIEVVAQCAIAGFAWWLIPSYSEGWRYFIAASSVPSFVVAILLMFSVESPRYLVTHQKTTQAWSVFSWIACVNCKDLETIVAKDDFFGRLASFNYKRPSSTKVSSLSNMLVIFKAPYFRRTMCFIVIFSIANCVPYNTTLFLPNYLTAVNLNPYFIVLIGMAAQLPGVALIAIIVEWPEFGRLNTLRLYTLLSIIFFLLFAFVQNDIATPIFIVLVYFSLVPASGLLSTYISESYPTEIRVMTLGFMTTAVSITGTWYPFAVGYLTDHSERYSWLSPTYSAVIMTVQLVFALILNHETRGRKLADVIHE